MAIKEALEKLDFNEPLIQQGKRETTEALLRRLKTLKQKLASLEQDMTDVRSLDPVRKPLIHQTILHHKDRGVRALAACCLADLLRLYAPDAPYSDSQLRDIFQFFLTQLHQNLQTSTPPSRQGKNKAVEPSQTTLPQRITDIPYYTEYHALIDSLATIRSIVLICDVPGANDLMVDYFYKFMEIARPDMSKTLMRYLRDILVYVIEEARSLPSGVMDCLVSQFENYSNMPDTPSFQLAVEVCNEVADKLKRPFYAHFSEIQLTHGRDPSPNDLKILSQSHDLLLTINRFCPETLLNTVPLLGESLKAVDEVPLRQLSTRTLGHMFTQRPGAEDPSKKYPSTWNAWLSKKADKAVPVRLAWVETCKGVLVAHPEVREELEDAMVGRFADPDEKVRLAMCKVIGSLDYETALHHVKMTTIRTAAGRILDKKSSVRAEAAQGIAKLWDLAHSGIESGDEEAIRQFAWIPEEMISAIFKAETADIRVQIVAAIKTSILPLPQDADDEGAWVDRLLMVASHLDENSRRGLAHLTHLVGFARGFYPYHAFVKSCEDYGGGEGKNAATAKNSLAVCINHIARTIYGDPEKAKKDLQLFADINEPRLFKLYSTCVDVQSSLSAIVKARNELLRRVIQSHEDLLPCIKTLLDFSSWNILNHSSIHPLLKHLQKPVSEASASAAVEFLALIAKECPLMFKTHVQELVAAVADRKNVKLAEAGLQALGSVCKVFPEIAPNDKTIERAISVAQEGTPRQAKFAARFLGRTKDAETICVKLIDAILKTVKSKTVDEVKQLTYLTALSELAKTSPKAFARRSTDVIKYVMNDVLLETSPSSEVDGDEWIARDELEPLDQSKLIGLRICTHWCLGYNRDPDATQLILPTLTLLISVLSNDGMISTKTAEGGQARCHMRLRAAFCLLKLARVKVFDNIVTGSGRFEIISATIQDPCYMVRHLWLKKLGTVIGTQEVSGRWNMMPALAAMDPEQENISEAKKLLMAIPVACHRKNLPRNERIARIELPFARLLHLLTHHPDFDWHESEGDDEEMRDGIPGLQNLKDISKFIELYLDCLANRDNVGLLYHIAGQLKTVRDRSTENSKPLYALSELAQIIIRNRAERQSWSVPVYPGKVSLPADIFHHPESPEERARVQKTQFLDEETRSWARNLGKRPVAVRRLVPVEKTTPRKRVNSSPSRNKKKRRQNETSDEDSDGSSSASDSEPEPEECDTSDADGDDQGSAAVLGRGGTRGAKTKANKAVGKKGRKEKRKEEEMEVDEEM